MTSAFDTTTDDVPAKPSRTREHTRETRDVLVMAAAIAVISERGYAAATVQEVADRVGMLKGSLYYYFASKEDLLFRILEECHAEARQIAEDVAALDLAPLEHLLEYVRRTSVWYLENTERANIYFSEGRQLSDEKRVQLLQLKDAFESRIIDLVSKAQAAGTASTAASASLTGAYLIGALNSVRNWPVTEHADPGSAAETFVALTRHLLA